MARTFVNAGRRRQFPSLALNRAGDLTYNGGFFGVQQDDVKTVGDLTMHILEGVWDLPSVFAGAAIAIPAGAKVSAAPSAVYASSHIVYPAASVPAGGVAIGRAWTTYPSGASYIRVALFGAQNQY